MRLVYKETRKPVMIGDKVILDDGVSVTVTHFAEPHKPAATGKVSVSRRIPRDTLGCAREYYVGVIGAEWIDRQDRTHMKCIEIMWGENPERDEREPQQYQFETSAEITAFREGIEACDGWLNYEILYTDEESSRSNLKKLKRMLRGTS